MTLGLDDFAIYAQHDTERQYSSVKPVGVFFPLAEGRQLPQSLKLCVFLVMVRISLNLTVTGNSRTR